MAAGETRAGGAGRALVRQKGQRGASSQGQGSLSQGKAETCGVAGARRSLMKGTQCRGSRKRES